MQKTAPQHSPRDLQPELAAHAPNSAADIPASVDTSENDDDDLVSPSDYGSIKLSTCGVSYVNSAHWAAVLDGIAELKGHFEKEDEQRLAACSSDPPQPDLAGPQLLYGCPKHATKEEILAAVPTRSVVDRLISRYFNALDMAPG